MMYLTPMQNRMSFALADAFRDFDRMERAFFGSDSAFATDIRDMGESYRLDIELPGFSKEEIKVSLSGKMLTVAAEHSEDKSEEGKYLRRERRFGSFSRSFSINGIDADAISVTHENGVLSLTLPKVKPSEPQTREFEIR